jgi:Mrp family chromosome partitioning ATPase/capsular polysaccharide biosynthesis protein
MSLPAPHERFSAEETFDLRAYVRPLWRHRRLIVVIVAIAAIGTLLVAAVQPKQYVASASVYITVADPASALESIASSPTGPSTPPTAQQTQDIAALFTATAITEAVYRQLDLPLGSAGSVTVAPVMPLATGGSSSPFIVVQTTSRSSRLAARVANTYVSVFLASRRSAQAAAASADASELQASLNALPNVAVNVGKRRALMVNIAQYQAIVSKPSAGAQVVEVAVPPSSPISPKPLHDALFAAVIAALLAIAIAFILELEDRRLVAVKALRSIYRRPVLATVPCIADPAPLLDGCAVLPPRLVETFRGLGVSLRLDGGERPSRTLLVVSALPGEGRSTVARDLAVTYADAGERVLLIDADLRSPGIARLCGLDPSAGLTHVLAGEAQLAATVRRVPLPATQSGAVRGGRGVVARAATPAGTLDVLADPEPVDNPLRFLSSAAMNELLVTTSKHYDAIVLDSAPLLTVSDTLPLLAIADAVLLVARLGLTTKDAAAHVADMIDRVPSARLVGLLANDVRDSFLEEKGVYYGDYGYSGATRGQPTAEPG